MGNNWVILAVVRRAGLLDEPPTETFTFAASSGQGRVFQSRPCVER